MSDKYKIGNDFTAILPVGVKDRQGNIYKTVELDEISAEDLEALTNPKFRNKSSKAMSTILRRCIQNIPGFVKKDNPEKLIDEEIVDKMTVADRDTLLLKILVISDMGDRVIGVECPKCGTQGEYDFDLSNVEVTPAKGLERSFNFELKKPITLSNKTDGSSIVYKSGTFRFPTVEVMDRVAGKAAQNDGAFTLMLKTIAQCVRWDREDGKEPDGLSYDILRRKLKGSEVQKLMKAQSDNIPGPEFKQEVECGNCGHKYDHEIPLERFLLPQ